MLLIYFPEHLGKRILDLGTFLGPNLFGKNRYLYNQLRIGLSLGRAKGKSSSLFKLRVLG